MEYKKRHVGKDTAKSITCLLRSVYRQNINMSRGLNVISYLAAHREKNIVIKYIEKPDVEFMCGSIIR